MSGVDVGAAILAGMEQARARRAAPPSLEEFITSPEYCNFTASEVQRGLVRALDGLPPGLDPARMNYHFGAADFCPPDRPKWAVLECGVRAGKSLVAALCGNVYSSLYCDVSVVRPGELIKSFIVAPRIQQARGTFRHALGTLMKSPRLSQYLRSSTKESLTIVRPDGVEVELLLVAAAPEGQNLRSTWVAGATFSEADFFDADDSAVNLTDNYEAVRPRLLPRAQGIIESSPWADEGQFHKLMLDFFGKPAFGFIAFHSDSRAMFPGLDRDVEAKMRAADPEKAAREYDAIPLSTSGTDFFPAAAVRACVNAERPLILPPLPNYPHFGGADLGFRKNSSAVAYSRLENDRVRVAYYDELKPRPGEPLKPSVVCKAFAEKGLEYFASSVRGDGHYVETAREEFPKHQVQRGGRTDRVMYDPWNPSRANMTEAFTRFRELMLEGRLELPNDPRLLNQIEKTKSRAMPGGEIQIVHAKQGWTHGDLLQAVVLSAVQVPSRPVAPASTWSGTVNDSRWGDSGGRGF